MKNRMSVIFLAVSLVACLALQIPKHVSAQEVELDDGVVITAEVLAIDYVDRVLTVIGPEGNIVDLEVSSAVRNFDQIRLGDLLRVKYYESVALYLGKHGAMPQTNAGIVVVRSAKGEKPAGGVLETVDVSARVKAIDKKKGTVTLELPHGKKVTTKADKSTINTLKVGDSIHARYTEAFAISIEKP